MTADGLDALIRNTFPATDIPPDQVQRVMAGVFARLEQPAPRPAPTILRRLSDWLAEATPAPALLLRQAALPVAVAAALGILAGQASGPETPPGMQLMASLASPPPLLSADY